MNTHVSLIPEPYVWSEPPLGDAKSAPTRFYTDPAVFKAEMEHIHLKTWFFAGRVEDTPNPGDYKAIDTVGGPALLVRDEQGVLRAFANVCRHRASILLQGMGNTERINCPYHAWNYLLDGTLAGAPGMREVPKFEKPPHGLIRIRMEIWEGAIFLNYDDAAPPIAACPNGRRTSMAMIAGIGPRRPNGRVASVASKMAFRLLPRRPRSALQAEAPRDIVYCLMASKLRATGENSIAKQVASVDASGRDLSRLVEAKNSIMKLLPRVLLLGVLSGFAATQANADDLANSGATSARKPAKTKAIAPTAHTQDRLGVKFSNPYAPPEGTAQPKGLEFPTAQRAAPTDPKGGMSFTAKWKATDGPIDPFWNIRNAPGQEAPGDSFLGGLKLGF